MMMLLVLDRISLQRARFDLGVVDDWCWPMFENCRYDGKRRGEGYRLLHEIHGEEGAVHEQGGRGIVYNHIFTTTALGR